MRFSYNHGTLQLRDKALRQGPLSAWMRVAVLLCIFFVLIVSCCGARGENRPNILFAIGDNWAYPHASSLGDPTVRTPVFDRIAEEGLLFRNAFCSVPSCSPARATLLSGRVAHQLGEAASLWSNFERIPVFTERLAESGYEVGFTGKGWSPGRTTENGWAQNPAGKEYASFEEFMQQRDPKKPFFFWYGDTSVALGRWRYGPEHWGDMDWGTVQLPPNLPDTVEVRETILAYYGAIQKQDSIFGTAIKRIEEAGLLDDTLVIYTSDNGWQMPRGLANCYDAGVRIPLAMRWGNQIKPGGTVDGFVSLIDFAPTMLELAGLPVPGEMSGQSFAGELNGQGSTANRDFVFLERERHANVRQNNGSFPIRAIRTRDYLYIWNLRPNRWPAGDPQAWMSVGDFGDVDGSWAKDFICENRADPKIEAFFELNFGKRPDEELYDLEKDPHQITNVAGDSRYESVRKQLRGRVETWMRETSDPRTDPSYDDWDRFAYFGGTVFEEDGTRKPKRMHWLERKRRTGPMSDAGVGGHQETIGNQSGSRRERLLSVDALRGFDMFWIVGAGTVAKAMDELDPGPVTSFVSTQLTHVQWEGFRFYDLIFPLFLFIVGISTVFSLDKAWQTGGRRAVLRRVFLRSLLLFFLGILYYGGFSKPWPEVRLAGVLHRIAACYFFAALIYSYVRSTRALLIVSTALLVGYWAWLTFVPIPNLQLEETEVTALAQRAGSESPFAIAVATEEWIQGSYEEGRNLTNFVDFLFLPGDKPQKYYINEGLLSTLPAIALCLFGILAGRLLKDDSVDPNRKVQVLLAGGALLVVFGLLWSLQFPIIKRIWTSSFVLVAGGLSAWMLALFYWLIDVQRWRRWCMPFVWIGCNALVIYLGVRIISFQKLAEWFTGGDLSEFLDENLASGAGSLATAVVSLLLVFLVARWLYNRKIFIRV